MTDTRINTALITTSEYKDLLLKTEIRDSKERYENAANEYKEKYDKIHNIIEKEYEDKINYLTSKVDSLNIEMERLKHSNSELYWKVDSLNIEMERLKHSNSELYWEVNTWKKIVNRYKSHWAVKLFIGKKYEID